MEFLNSAGVYRITCKTTGNFYIGSAVNFKRRWKHHKFQLNKDIHDSKYMQNSWNKYGEDAFEFDILVVCDKSFALMYEQLFLDALIPQFNTCKVAGSALGVKHSQQTKDKFSKAQRTWRKKYDWKGEMLCLSDIAEKEQFNYKLLMARVLGLGKTPEEAIAMGAESRNRFYEHDGKSQRIKEWAADLDITAARLRHYLDRGLNIGEVKSKLLHNDKRISLAELCKLNGANLQTVKSRIQKGMDVMTAITKPSREMDNTWRFKEAA
jgi:group I intron endonuclease